MTTSKLMTRARVEGFVIVAVAAAYLWQTHEIPDLFQMPGVPGPTAFPTLVGVLFGVAGLWRMLVAGRARALDVEPAWAEGDGGGGDEDGASGGSWLSRQGKFYAMWAVLLAYLAAMPHLGFPLTTVVALAALFALLGERRWAMTVGLAVATTVVLYVGFAWGLAVQLPKGVLAPFMK